MSKLLGAIDYDICLENVAKGESPKVVLGRTCGLLEKLVYTITAPEVVAMMYDLPAAQEDGSAL